MTDRWEANDSNDCDDAALAMLPADSADPTEPIESTEPTEPMLSAEFSDAMLSTELRDQSDHFDVSAMAAP
jgi:hypothetical protein